MAGIGIAALIWPLNALQKLIISVNRMHLGKALLLSLWLPLLGAVLLAATARLEQGPRAPRVRRGWCVAAVIIALGVLVSALLARTTNQQELNFELFGRIWGSLREKNGLLTFWMNVLFFEPLGIALIGFWPKSWTFRRRLLLTALCGLLLSLVVETLQYVFAVGWSEVDDLVANALGAALGTAALPLSSFFSDD